MTVLEKRADWSRLYSFDFANFEEIRAGETLTGTPTVSVPGGLTAGAPTISGHTVEVVISGGTVNSEYDVSCTITTSGGRTLSILGRLDVIA